MLINRQGHMRKSAVLLALLTGVLLLPCTTRAAELVMFDDPSCVWCRKWMREIGPGYPHSDEGQRAPLRRVDISAQRTSGVTLKVPVTATPTFVVTDDDGREVGRITGYQGSEFFYPALDEILEKLPARRPHKPVLRDTSLPTRQ